MRQTVSRAPLRAALCVGLVTCGAAHASPIVMERVAMIATSEIKVLSTSHGFDFDDDGRREFVLKAFEEGDGFGGRHEFYECTANDTFALRYTLELADHSFDSYSPADAGDIDEDGLGDLIVRVRDFVGRRSSRRRSEPGPASTRC